MSTQTTNLGLVKPDGPDRALVAVINENMNKIDQYAGEVNDSLGAVEDGMAIVADGNTHVAITSGQFVYVRNHSTLTQGLYTATANIAANATLSTSNLTADPSGGLNALNSKLTLQDVKNKFDGNTDFTFSNKNAYRSGNVVELRMVVTGELVGGFMNVGKTTLLPVIETELYVRDLENSNIYVCRILIDGIIQIYKWGNLTQSSSKSMCVSGTYITAS